MQELILKASLLTTEMIKEIIEKLQMDFRGGTDLVENVMLDELETRITSKEFVEFCEAL